MSETIHDNKCELRGGCPYCGCSKRNPPLRRDLWSNEEVIALLEGLRMEPKEFHGNNFPQKLADIHNNAVDEAQEIFKEFKLDSSVSGAMAYDPKTKFRVHIGPLLPE